MSGSNVSFKLWLTRWFGIGSTADTAKNSSASNLAENDVDSQGPLFSLGDTKQDVVVSFRAAQTDKP